MTVDMLTGIAAVSPGSAWAIGSSTAGYFLLRWNGKAWSVDRLFPRNVITNAIGSAGGRVWIVGVTSRGSVARPVMYEYDGRS